MQTDEARTVLGVDASATDDTIRRAWRSLALRCHPDKNPDDPEAAAKFRECTAAFKALTGKDENKSYNELCAEMDDVRSALVRAQQLASTMDHVSLDDGGKAPTAEKVLTIGATTWIGEVASGRPNGTGDLVLPNGRAGRGRAGLHRLRPGPGQ